MPLDKILALLVSPIPRRERSDVSGEDRCEEEVADIESGSPKHFGAEETNRKKKEFGVMRVLGWGMYALDLVKRSLVHMPVKLESSTRLLLDS